MRLDTYQTATLYTTLSPEDVALLTGGSYPDPPSLGHDLTLHTSPELSSPQTPFPHILARLQIRSDCLAALLGPDPDTSPHITVPARHLPDLLHALVGPIAVVR